MRLAAADARLVSVQVPRKSVRGLGGSSSMGNRFLAIPAMIAVASAALLGACAVDDRRFPSTDELPNHGGSANAGAGSDAAVNAQSGESGGPGTNVDGSGSSLPTGVTGSIGCDAGACGCDPAAESCAPLPICADGGATCEDTCPGCVIAGECVAPQAVAPDNSCQICDPARDRFVWSNNDGAPCDDELFCTTEDVCGAGRCEGTPRECDDGVACNGVSTCVEESDGCSPDVNQCTNGSVCSVAAGACVSTCAGCVISGVCIESGAEEAGNPCRVCDPARSVDAFSPAPGKACGAAANTCSQRDTCNAQGACQANDLPAGTSCGDSSSSTCDLPDACDGSGVCQTRRASNGTPCDDEQFCTVGDSCQGGSCVATGNRNCGANQACNEGANQCQCQGCAIGNTCFASGVLDPNNPCRICDPSRSTTAFSANTGASCGSGPTTCSAQDTCNAQGVCAPNHTTGGCEDGLFCTTNDRCNNGACSGGGATCIANQSCNENTNQCVCAGGTLNCISPAGGNPNCSSWSFESGQTEGWGIDDLPGDSNASGGLDVIDDANTPGNSRALRVRFLGTGSPDQTMVFIRVTLCGGNNAVSIAGRRLRARVRLVTDPGTAPLTTQQGHLVHLYTGDQFPFAGGDFSVDPATGGGAAAGSYHEVDVNLSEQFSDRAETAVQIGFRFLVDTPWRGNVYIDDIRID